MSIHDQTIKQLVRNQVHQLTDIVMDMNIKQGRRVALSLLPGRVSVVEEMPADRTRLFSASLPPNLTPAESLDRLEWMVAEVSANHSRGAEQ